MAGSSKILSHRVTDRVTTPPTACGTTHPHTVERANRVPVMMNKLSEVLDEIEVLVTDSAGADHDPLRQSAKNTDRRQRETLSDVAKQMPC